MPRSKHGCGKDVVGRQSSGIARNGAHTANKVHEGAVAEVDRRGRVVWHRKLEELSRAAGELLVK